MIYYNNTNSISFSSWNHPELINATEKGETIEMIYRQTSNFYRTGGLPPYNDTRIFKIVYSCVNGKWNKSEPIYGKVITSQEESFEFE
jgi:hypothetical protein